MIRLHSDGWNGLLLFRFRCGFAVQIEHLDEVSAHDGPRHESAAIGLVGVDPVGHRNAVERLVHEVVNRSDEGLEGRLILGQRGRPHDPVGLRIGLAAVEREPVSVLAGQIVGDLLFGDRVGEDIQPEELVPDDVVFLAPGSGLVERQPVVVAVIGHLLPLGSHLAGLFGIALCHVAHAEHLGHASVGGDSEDGLDREVGVVGEVSRKIVRAELVLRVETLFDEVVGPRGECLPVLPCIVGIAFGSTEGRRHDQHVASLLDGHVATIGLAVGQRVGSHVVGREGLGPASAFAVIVDVVHDALEQLRVVVEEDGRRGVGDVDRSDQTAAVVLLREEEQLAVGSLDQLVGGERLAVGQGAQLGILLAAGCGCLLHQRPIEGVAAVDQFVVLLVGGAEFIDDRVCSVGIPVGAQILAEVLDRVDVVVADEPFAMGLASCSEVAVDGHCGLFVFARDGFGSGTSLDEGAAQLFAGADGRRGGRIIVRSQQEVAPVDSQIVALLGQNVLLLASGLDEEQSVLSEPLGNRLLIGIIEGPAGRCLEIELRLMILAVVRRDGIGDVVYRAADQLQLLGHEGCREGKPQIDPSADERIVCLRGLDINPGLPGRLFEHRVPVLLDEQPEIEQSVSNRIPAVGRNQVFTLFEALDGLFRELHLGILVAGDARLVDLDAVDVEFGVVVVREHQIDGAIFERLVEREGPAHPDVFGRPVGLGRRFVDLRTEGSTVLFPGRIVESGLEPVGRGLGGRVAAVPSFLLRGRHHGSHLHLFDSQEPVGYPVDLQHADQREVLAGPVFDGSVVEVVGHRPGAGVGIDGHERIGRCAEFA